MKELLKKILIFIEKRHIVRISVLFGMLQILAGCLLMICAEFLRIGITGPILALLGMGLLIASAAMKMGTYFSKRPHIGLLWVERDKKIHKRIRLHKRIRVVFYSDGSNYWNTYSDLYKLLSEDVRFDVALLAAPEKKGNPLGNDFSYDICEFLDAQNLSYIKGYDSSTETILFPEAMKADYVFFNRHYSSRRPAQYNNLAWAKHSKLCYIPYNACMANGKTLETVCGFRELQYYDFLFSENQRLTKIYESMRCRYPSSKTHIYTVGSLKFEKVRQWSTEERTHRDQTILYTPRWNTSEGICSFFELYEYFFDLVASHPEIQYIFRPHPLMKGEIGRMIGADKWDELIMKFDEYPNARIDLDPSYKQSFLDATILISDMSSMMFEFFILGKPVVYMHLGEVLNAFGESIARGFYHCKTKEELDIILHSLFDGNDRLIQRRKEILATEYEFGQLTAAEHIRDILLQDAKWVCEKKSVKTESERGLLW